jgi:ribose transport system permease protein
MATTAPATPQPSVSERRQSSPVMRLVAGLPVLQIVALIVLFVVTAVTVSGFLSKSSLYSVLVLAAFLGLAAAGQTVVILIGGIDLSPTS